MYRINHRSVRSIYIRLDDRKLIIDLEKNNLDSVELGYESSNR